jgi:hypothetical protein
VTDPFWREGTIIERLCGRLGGLVELLYERPEWRIIVDGKRDLRDRGLVL